VILPGDQPRVRPDVIRRLVDATTASAVPLLIAPLYDSDGAPNPILARRAAWRLADELVGDRGFGPLLTGRPDLVQRIPVEGSNPDVDTREDLQRLAEAGEPAADVS
jgi:CTP:molybdopterin cytidylyltransferase MocA